MLSGPCIAFWSDQEKQTPHEDDHTQLEEKHLQQHLSTLVTTGGWPTPNFLLLPLPDFRGRINTKVNLKKKFKRQKKYYFWFFFQIPQIWYLKAAVQLCSYTEGWISKYLFTPLLPAAFWNFRQANFPIVFYTMTLCIFNYHYYFHTVALIWATEEICD